MNARWQERLAVAQRLRPAARGGAPGRGPRRERVAVGGIALGLVLCIGAPLVALVERSLRTGDGYGLGAWEALVHGSVTRNVVQAPAADALATSLVFALATLCIAGPLGPGRGPRRGIPARLGAADVRRARDAAAGHVRGHRGPRASWSRSTSRRSTCARASLLIPIAHSLVALPFVVRAIAPVVRSIDPRLREAAAVLGAAPVAPGGRWTRRSSPGRRSWAPRSRSRSRWASSGRRCSSRVPRRTTVPVAIERLLSRPGPLAFGQAMALSTVLMVVTGVTMLAIERWRAPGSTGF